MSMITTARRLGLLQVLKLYGDIVGMKTKIIATMVTMMIILTTTTMMMMSMTQ
jgi:hypothetical protein